MTTATVHPSNLFTLLCSHNTQKHPTGATRSGLRNALIFFSKARTLFNRISYLFYRRHLRPLSRHEGQLMTTITIWHNPRCSKSRTALALLEERGVQPTQVKYLETPPTVNEIRRVLRLLGVSAIDLMRRGEATFQELNLSSDTSEDELISAMVSHPILIERPVIISATQAVIGRPPENATALL